jgi:flagellar protein FlaG
MAGSVVLGESGVAAYQKALPIKEASETAARPDQSVSENEAKKTPSPPQKSQQTDVLTKESVEDVAEALGAVAKVLDRKLSFKVDDETGRIMIQVKDGEGNIIRSIPPEDIRNMRESMGSLVGLIYNDRS